MRSPVVVVAYEAQVLLEQVRLYFVGFMESFDFAYSSGPAYAGSDMLDSRVLTTSCKL
jgi:hypothetical protein